VDLTRSARLLRSVPAASGAIVMATGIESIALRLAGERTLSAVLMWLAIAAAAALALIALARAAGGDPGLASEARSPACLTWVAGACVLGTRITLEGWRAGGLALLALGAIGCAALQVAVWRSWRTPATGAGFLTTVSVESLAVLCAALAIAYRAPWLVVAATVLGVVGLALYPVVLARFDRRELLAGHGDEWVAGGALAIAALAAASLGLAATRLAAAAALADDLRAAAIVIGVAAAAWLPVLLAAEAMRPRPSYDVRRWATVFPVAMYAVAGMQVGRLADAGWLTAIARAWVWVALVVWAVVATGMLLRAPRALPGRLTRWRAPATPPR
jgi:tellurite resistance protein TehA-like permease